MELMVNGQNLQTTEQGFLIDWQLWDESVAEALARREDIDLKPAHWEILHFIRAYYRDYKHLPNARLFVKAVKQHFGEDKGCSRYLHLLFPNGPLKFACKIAGLPKPPTCL